MIFFQLALVGKLQFWAPCIESVFFECRFRKQLWISASSIWFLGSAPWPFNDLGSEWFWSTFGELMEFGQKMQLVAECPSKELKLPFPVLMLVGHTYALGAQWILEHFGRLKIKSLKLMNSCMTSWKFVNLGPLSIYFMYLFMNLILKFSQVVISFKSNTEENKFGRNFRED